MTVQLGPLSDCFEGDAHRYIKSSRSEYEMEDLCLRYSPPTGIMLRGQLCHTMPTY
jgi:hypothetical protein